MKKTLFLLGLSSATLLFWAQVSQAQTPSCLKATYAGEPVRGVISWDPYQVDPNDCIDTTHAPAGTSHSVDTSGLEPGVSVTYQSAVPVTSVRIEVYDDSTCPLKRVFPNLSTLSGTTSGNFSLTFARDSGYPNLIGMAQVMVIIEDSNGDIGGFMIYQYCRGGGGYQSKATFSNHSRK
jgi:hypothetical protein